MNERGLRAWDDLSDEERTRLLEAYGHYQDQLPGTCSLSLKVERFQTWLRSQGIDYRHPT